MQAAVGPDGPAEAASPAAGGSGIRVAWDKTARAFVPASEPDDIRLPHPRPRPQLRRLPTEELLKRFATLDLVDTPEAYVACREELHGRFVDHEGEAEEETATLDLGLARAYLSSWQVALDAAIAIVENDRAPSQRHLLCSELLALARWLLRMGDVQGGRAMLGSCIRLARLADSSPSIDNVAVEAKRVLIDCVQFQLERERIRNVLLRATPPPIVLHQCLTKIDGALLDTAPWDLQLWTFKTRILKGLRRSASIVSLLSATPLTPSSAELTLALAEALEYEGFYHESVRVVVEFLQSSTQEDADCDPINLELSRHHAALSELLRLKTQAESALHASEWNRAEDHFTTCLRLASPQSRVMRSSLLFGRANARIQRGRVLSARTDLKASLELNPSNQLVRMRLRTLELEHDTLRLEQRLLRLTGATEGPSSGLRV